MGRKHKFDYFGAFEQHSKLAVAESALLVETIEQFTEASALEENTQKAHEIEHEGDTINHKIFKTVATDFITPIDREDIIEMCQALDDIVDDIEDVMLRFYMYDIHFMHDQAIEFAKLIQGSCEALDKAMCDFRNFKKSKNFVHLIVKVHDLEEQARASVDEPVRQHGSLLRRMRACSRRHEHHHAEERVGTGCTNP